MYSESNSNLIEDFNKEISIYDLVNEKISIYDLVIKNDIELKKQGKNWMGLCPFHSEKTPSFSVSIEKNIAVCMACHKGGNPIIFYSKLKKISTEKAIQELSQIFNLELPKKKIFYQNPLYEILESVNDYYQKSLLFLLEREEYSEHPLKKYLFQTRELNLGLIKKFGLGYAYNDKNSLIKYLLQKNYKIKDLLELSLINDNNTNFFQDRIMFPLTNSEGLIVGFCGRVYQEKSKQTKYLFNKTNSLFKKDELLYRFFEHRSDIEEKKELILFEGFFDVISFYKKEKTNTIATLGTNLSSKQISLLKKITKKIIIAFDGDNAGQEATQKIKNLLIYEKFRVYITKFPSGLDPDNFVLKNNISNISFSKQFEEIIELCLSKNIQESFRELSQESKTSIKEVNGESLILFLIEVFFNSTSMLELIIDKSSSYVKIPPDIIELIRIFKEYRKKENNLTKEGQKEEINKINISNFKKDCEKDLKKLDSEIFDLLSKVENHMFFKSNTRMDIPGKYLDTLFQYFYNLEKKEKEKKRILSLCI